MAEPDGVLLSLERVNVFYDAIHALRDVSLSVRTGEVVTLLGLTGPGSRRRCGPSPAADAADGGRIVFDARTSPARLRTGWWRAGSRCRPRARRVRQSHGPENLEMAPTSPAAWRPSNATWSAVSRCSQAQGAHEAARRHAVGRRTADLAMARPDVAPKLLCSTSPRSVSPRSSARRSSKPSTKSKPRDDRPARRAECERRAEAFGSGVCTRNRAVIFREARRRSASDPRVREAYLGE